ncbi:glycosyl transferase family 2 [Mycoplasmopsis mustelae]|uniref:Glycosyl transferase family 2 n=1 Tax=Mycoplasmopsis mustelae TaxID=171289 RepID=A0A4R7UC17_9BACT|nr:glycosyltransferase [Mycoplasmopsis mustelae]TDV23266.1 glycosyl transferase family 2 [Mycoplasmopsis mustelae]
MKLSLISVMNDSKKDVEKYLKDLLEQDNQDFEIILCINKTNEEAEIINLIANYQLYFNDRLISIYNSKNSSYQYNLMSAFQIAKGDFVATLNTDVSLKKYYVNKMITAAVKYDVDVLEFRPRIIGSIRWKPKQRNNIEEPTLTAKSKNIIAYAYPFVFNKIFKKQLIKKILSYKPLNTNDTKMCVEINYILLLESKNYMYLNYGIYREFFESEIWFNSKRMLSSFDGIQKWITNSTSLEKYENELNYAKLYFFKLLLTAFLKETTILYRYVYQSEKKKIKETRTKMWLQKHYELIEKIEKEYQKNKFELINPYIHNKLNEVSLLLLDNKKLRKIGILSSLE